MERENIKEDNTDNKEEPKEGGNHFVYFIDSHEKDKKYNIYLPSEYKGANSLEKIKEQEIDELCIEVYRFIIIPGILEKDEDQNYQILILATDEEENEYEYMIKFPDETKDFFEYDFKVEEIDYILLSHEEQFEIYVEILRPNSPEKENLIISTNKLFNKKDQKINFTLYLLMFLECYNTKHVQEHLLNFNPKKIEGFGKFPKSRLNQIQNELNKISENPQENLYLNKAKDEEELIELFYSILLYFNMNFQKEKVEDMFKDENTLTYLSKRLISFRIFYQDLVLPQDIVRKLIQKAKTFDEILGNLPYIGTDIIEFLKLINLELDIINNKAEKKEMNQIEIEKFVIPKREDNIQKLVEVTNIIFASDNIPIIKFSTTLIEKYVKFYYKKDLESLQLINNLIYSIKQKDKTFQFKYNNQNMDLVIHDTGIELVKSGKIKNNEILDFIIKDTYYNSEKYEKYRPLEIFDGIDIETLDNKFFDYWYKINFDKMFSTNINNFYTKILSLIKDMKDFGLLYKFFLYNNAKEYKSEVILKMKNKYKNIFPTYNIEKCTKFEDDTIKLISLLDKKKKDLKDLLDLIQTNLDYEKVNQIYIELSKNNELNKSTKDVIVKHFTENKINTNASSLVYLIINCPNLRKEILSKINKYIITENDFFSLEETENFKLYKGLIDNEILNKELKDKDTSYAKKVQSTISSLKKK